MTPSYNQGKFLEETIQSVLRQDYPNLEYIIIDGGSTDNSVEVIKKYAERLAFWESKVDRGFGHALNKGFSKATGDILCWLNSDDILLPNTLTVVAAFFKQFPNTGVLTGDRWYLDEASRLLFKTRYYFFLPGQFRFTKTLAQESTFWRRDVFLKAGGYVDEELKFAIDFDLWCRLAKVTRIRHVPFYFGAYRVQPDSKSSNIIEIGRIERRKLIVRHYGASPCSVIVRIYLFFLSNLKRVYRISGAHAVKVLLYRRKLKNLGWMT